MALLLKENLNVQGMALTIPCAGQSYVGIGVTGTFSGTLFFYGSTDGVNFQLLNATPYASGTATNTTTATGSWFVQVGNIVAVQVQCTAFTSGNPAVTLSTSQDGSYVDAFLTTAQIYQFQQGTANASNTLTIAANTNHAWNLRTLSVSVVGGTPSGTVQIKDGTTVLLQYDLTASATSATLAGTIVNIPLPQPSNAFPTGGVVTSVNSALAIVVSALGTGVISTIQAEVHAV